MLRKMMKGNQHQNVTLQDKLSISTTEQAAIVWSAACIYAHCIKDSN